jgi:hypothetical protein
MHIHLDQFFLRWLNDNIRAVMRARAGSSGEFDRHAPGTSHTRLPLVVDITLYILPDRRHAEDRSTLPTSLLDEADAGLDDNWVAWRFEAGMIGPIGPKGTWQLVGRFTSSQISAFDRCISPIF